MGCELLINCGICETSASIQELLFRHALKPERSYPYNSAFLLQQHLKRRVTLQGYRTNTKTRRRGWSLMEQWLKSCLNLLPMLQLLFPSRDAVLLLSSAVFLFSYTVFLLSSAVLLIVLSIYLKFLSSSSISLQRFYHFCLPSDNQNNVLYDLVCPLLYVVLL